MVKENSQSNTPSNLDLIHEGAVTRDCKRQQELAGHSSFFVRQSVANNPMLCAEAAEILGDELTVLRASVRDQVKGA